jgi:hypothetical protein
MNAHAPAAAPGRLGAAHSRTIGERVALHDWSATEAALDEHGWAPLAKAPTAAECDALAALYPL